MECFYCRKKIGDEKKAIKLYKGGKMLYFCSQEHLEEFLRLTSTPSC